MLMGLSSFHISRALNVEGLTSESSERKSKHFASARALGGEDRRVW